MAKKPVSHAKRPCGITGTITCLNTQHLRRNGRRSLVVLPTATIDTTGMAKKRVLSAKQQRLQMLCDGIMPGARRPDFRQRYLLLVAQTLATVNTNVKEQRRAIHAKRPTTEHRLVFTGQLALTLYQGSQPSVER